MGTSQFTPNEVLAVVGHTYQSIDIRVAAVLEEHTWCNSFAIVRFSHLSPQLLSEALREELGEAYRLETAHFRIETQIRPFSDLERIRGATKKGFITANKLRVRLRPKVDWSALPAGYLVSGGMTTRPWDGERWPGVEIVRAQSQSHALYDPIRCREVSAKGFESPYEAIADICRANVWPGTSHSGDLYIWMPVLAALKEPVLSPDRHQLCAQIRKHAALEGLQTTAALSTAGGQGPARRSSASVVSRVEKQHPSEWSKLSLHLSRANRVTVSN